MKDNLTDSTVLNTRESGVNFLSINHLPCLVGIYCFPAYFFIYYVDTFLNKKFKKYIVFYYVIFNWSKLVQRLNLTMYFFNSYFIPSPFSLSFFLSFCLGVALPLQSHRPTLNLFTPTNIKHVSFTTSLYSVTQPFKLMLCRRHLWYILRRLDYSAAIQELFSFLGIRTKQSQQF